MSTMPDIDLIALVYAENQHLDYPSSASTQASEEYNNPGCVELRFSRGSRTSGYFLFGKDKRCDIVIRGPGVSRHHCALTYKRSHDGFYCLIVRDLGSRQGTKVTYNGKGGEWRSTFEWIISGDSIPDATERVIIELPGNIQYRVVITRQTNSSPTYIANVKRFLQGSADTESLFGMLDIDTGVHTALATGLVNGLATSADPPKNRPILITEGDNKAGSFGSVTCVWDVSTGKRMACKTPLDKDKFEVLRDEIRVMQQLQHVNKTPFPNTSIVIAS